MWPWCCAGIVLAMVVGPADAQDTPVKTYGSAMLDAYCEPGQEIPDAVAFRYQCQIANNECGSRGNEQVWKIIF